MTTLIKADKFQDLGNDAVIPMHLILNKKVPSKAKEIYGVIRNLARSNGVCFASNQYLAGTFDIEIRSVRRLLRSLSDEGYLEVSFEKDDNYKRNIELSEEFKRRGGEDKIVRGGGQNCPHKEELLNIYKKEEDTSAKAAVAVAPAPAKVFFKEPAEVKKKKPLKVLAPESYKLSGRLWKHVLELCTDAVAPRPRVWEQQLCKFQQETGFSWDDISETLEWAIRDGYWMRKKILCPNDLKWKWTQIKVDKATNPQTKQEVESQNRALVASFSGYLEEVGVDIAPHHLGFKFGPLNYEILKFTDPDLKAKVIHNLKKLGARPPSERDKIPVA